MSKQFSIAVAIWARSVLFVGLISLFILPIFDGLAAFYVGIAIFIVGFILTAPLLPLITPLVKASVRLPYKTKASKAWLSFFLMLIAFIFLLSLGWIFGINYQAIFWKRIIISTLISVLLATLSVSKSFENYKMETDATNLV